MADTENNKNSNSPAERTQGNAPALRFPGFTEPWKVKNLEQICSINPKSGKVPEQFVYIDLESIEKGILKKKSIICRENAPSRAQRVVKYGDVLYQCVRPYQNNHFIFSSNNELEKYVASTGFAQLRNADNPYFLFYSIQTPRFTNDVLNRCTGSNYPAINSTDLSSIQIGVPTLREQEKISSMLCLLDERIETQRRLIEDLEKLKSSIVDRIFSDIDGETVKFRDILEISTQRNDGKAEYKILSASQEFGMIERESLDIDIKAEAKSVKTYKRVQPGDYVLHLRSFQGGLAFAEIEGICSPAYTILRPHNKLVYGYLREYFNSSKFIKSLVLVTYGIRDGRSINVEDFLDMAFTIHSKDKQGEIVRSLSTLNGKVNVETSILNRYEQQRAYLLGKLFI